MSVLDDASRFLALVFKASMSKKSNVHCALVQPRYKKRLRANVMDLDALPSKTTHSLQFRYSSQGSWNSPL